MKTVNQIVAEVWPGWELEELIGSGTFGEVYRATRDGAAGKAEAAVKVIRLNPQSLRALYPDPQEREKELERLMDRVSREIALMQKLKGQTNLVSIDDSLITEDTESGIRYILIRMELLTPLLVDLDIHAYGEDRLIRLGVDLCRGLEVCGQEQIVHRDIKPENIFLNRLGDYKLGDFSVARTLNQVREQLTEWDFVRGERFSAPEVKNGLMKEADFAEASRADLYSLGMVMYWIANGQRFPFLPADKQLFSTQDRVEAEQRRLRGEPLPPLPSVSPALQAVILKACAFESQDRYADAAAFRKALESLRNPEKQTEATQIADRKLQRLQQPASSPQARSRRNGTATWRKAGIVAAALAVLAFAALWCLLPKQISVRYVSEEGEYLASSAFSLQPGSSTDAFPDALPEGYVPQGASVIPVSVDFLRRANPAQVTFKCREAEKEKLPDTLQFDMMLYPHRYAMGLPFSFLGTVASDVPLTELKLCLYAGGEPLIQQAEIPEGACSYEMKDLGDQLLRKLPEGSFVFEIQAADAAGRRIGFSHTCTASQSYPEHDIYDISRFYMEPELKATFVYGGHTYEIYRQSGGGWDVAAAFAQGKGGHLATLSEENEYNNVTSYCLGMGRKWLNIGLQYKDGEWSWVDGSPLDFCPWSPATPSDEDCPYPPVGGIFYSSAKQWYVGKATQYEMDWFILEYDFEMK